MQLCQAVSGAEIDAVARYVDAPARTRLTTFQGLIINLNNVIIGAGFKRMDTGVFGNRDIVPNLAISRPNYEHCTFQYEEHKLVFNADGQATRIRCPEKIHGGLDDSNIHMYRVSTPPLPAEARKAVTDNPGETRVLFEAKDWTQVKAPPMPALDDPAIVIHLVGDLWGVLHTWDLTPMEKAALQKAGVGI